MHIRLYTMYFDSPRGATTLLSNCTYSRVRRDNAVASAEFELYGYAALYDNYNYCHSTGDATPLLSDYAVELSATVQQP